MDSEDGVPRAPVQSAGGGEINGKTTRPALSRRRRKLLRPCGSVSLGIIKLSDAGA